MKTKLKKIMLGASLALLGNFAANAQVGLEGIVVEKYYQSNAADAVIATAAGTTLNPGSVTYRVFVDLAAGWKYNLAFGNANHDWKVTTTTTFFNDPNNGQAIGPQGTSLNNTRNGLALIDTWLTTGGVCVGRAGITKAEDSDGAVSNIGGALTNPLGGIFGAPINSLVSVSAKDGLTPSSALTSVPPTVLGVGAAADCFDQTPGNQFLVNAGSVAALGGVVGTGTANMVLIGQFTTDGVLGFEFNIQVQNIATLASENYVAKNPQPGEFLFPGLLLAPPAVGITSPANNSNFVTGTQVAITATAASAGTVTSVEFKVDGTTIGTDLTAPFTSTYNSTAGSHTITAIATDNNSLTATSSAVVINVANNQAPNVSVAAPAGAITGQILTFTANAVDPDGTVASVTFSVDNIAIGTTAVGGPVYTYTWLATFGAHSLRASATDNLGAVGVSSALGFNVVNNIPPSAAIVSPLNNALFTGTTSPISVSATATDADGSVVSLELFANNVSVATATNAGPAYSFSWQPTAFGPNVLKVVATDNAAGTSTSAPITVNIANPNALPYEIVSVKQECDTVDFTLPINIASTYTVDDVIGIDFTLIYNAAKVTPDAALNSITVNSNIINPNYITILKSINNGTMYVSAAFNGNAPGNAEFNGTGNLFNIHFFKNVMTEVDTADFSIPTFDESYFIGVTPKLVSNGRYTTYRDTMATGRLKFWSNGAPMPYNASNPNDYLITNIYGSNSVCATSTAAPVQPDLIGEFNYNILNGDWITISRDILAGTSVFNIIDANDAFIGRQVVLNTPTLTPSVYQIVSLDVNLDGIVSSGDVSQMNQRAVNSIPEFKQAWNYNAAGTNTLGQPSKDYTFIDTARIVNDPAYSISATYPLNDNVGYSKLKVPNTPFCLAVNQNSTATCPDIDFMYYYGVLLGDADGDVAAASGTLQLRTSGENKLVVDLSKAIFNSNYVDVPVSFVSSVPVTGLDFAMKFDETSLTYNQMVNYASNTDAMAYFNPNDKFLKFTATNVDLAPFNANQSFASIRFETSNGTIDENQFNSLAGIINGALVPVEILSKTVGISSFGADNAVSVYPNPTNGILNITSIGDATVELFDLTGKNVLISTSVNASKTKQINVSELANGVYFVKISNNDFVTIKKVVLSK